MRTFQHPEVDLWEIDGVTYFTHGTIPNECPRERDSEDWLGFFDEAGVWDSKESARSTKLDQAGAELVRAIAIAPSGTWRDE